MVNLLERVCVDVMLHCVGERRLRFWGRRCRRRRCSGCILDQPGLSFELEREHAARVDFIFNLFYQSLGHQISKASLWLGRQFESVFGCAVLLFKKRRVVDELGLLPGPLAEQLHLGRRLVG